jgi:hypothetical protein
MNCRKYRPKAMVQKNTWLKGLPEFLPYYHVIGNPQLNKDYEFDELERTLIVKTNDDYNSLPKKVIAAYAAANKVFPNLKYLLKTDDDQALQNARFFHTLKEMLSTMTPKVHYGGRVVDVKQAHISQYYKVHPELPRDLVILPLEYCSGRFYFLSIEAVRSLIEHRQGICNEYFEDYAVGRYVDPAFKSNVLKINTDLFFKDFC